MNNKTLDYNTSLNNIFKNFGRNIKSILGLLASLTPFPPILTAWIHKIRGVKIKNIKKIFFSFDVYLDGIFPEYINIGENVYLTRGVKIISHLNSPENNNVIKVAEVIINNNVFIGVNSVILPGVEIGENAVIGAGSIVTKNIPSNTVAAGNPCRVIKEIKR